MKILGQLLLGLLLLLVNAESYGFFNKNAMPMHQIDRSAVPSSPTYGISELNRSSFPPGFIFGASSSAYQVEGGWNRDGKGQSNWDYFTHKYPGKIKDRSDGDMATDSYHRYREDVELLKNMNADSYRFSISWSRVLPRGKLSEGINEKGIQYYNNLIDELLANGLQPTVTIHHFDTPQALEHEYGGFLSENIINDFHDYADLCFERFGDRVKYWITINEPFTYAYSGYVNGGFPPARCSVWMKNNCTGGNSGTEPYIVGHNLLLAHADVVHLYRRKYQELQKGIIGISLPGTLAVPLTNSTVDRLAAMRFTDFTFGWWMDPIVYGDYPPIMRKVVGERLPNFTMRQSQLLSGSIDFLGFNYYTALYISSLDLPNIPEDYISYDIDMHINVSYTDTNGNLIGEQLGSDWLHVYPLGVWKFLLYIKDKYKNPIIYITENGADEVNKSNLTSVEALIDNFRIQYHFKHLAFIKKAIDEGVRVKGYFGWSILDNFEWTEGYTVRFGLSYVDYKTFKRYPKLSAQWFKRFLQK